MNVTVLGDGSWGTALALLLHGNGHDVGLWSAFSENAVEIAENRENRAFLPGIVVPSEIEIGSDLSRMAIERQPELVVLATPTQFLRGVLEQWAGLPDFSIPPMLVSVVKGIEMETCLRPSQMILGYLGLPVQCCVLSGPSHAEEVARQVPTAVVAACADLDAAALVRDLFMNDFFRVYTSEDVVGVELGGALKNIYAIAVGACEGMGLGDNSKAALMTRAIAEMTRLGEKLGGSPETFAGLGGVGDLIVTCISRHSRNYRVGQAIGRGKSIEQIAEEMGNVVAEGVKTTASARKLVTGKQVEAPIIEQAYQVLYCHKSPWSAIHDLMTRDPKMEKTRS